MSKIPDKVPTTTAEPAQHLEESMRPQQERYLAGDGMASSSTATWR